MDWLKISDSEDLDLGNNLKLVQQHLLKPDGECKPSAKRTLTEIHPSSGVRCDKIDSDVRKVGLTGQIGCSMSVEQRAPLTDPTWKVALTKEIQLTVTENYSL